MSNEPKSVPQSGEAQHGWQSFDVEELEYIYLHCDTDDNKTLFRRIEKKLRKLIPRYRAFDEAQAKDPHNPMAAVKAADVAASAPVHQTPAVAASVCEFPSCPFGLEVGHRISDHPSSGDTAPPELSVESALAELREMFPTSWFAIEVSERPNYRQFFIRVYGRQRQLRATNTLDEAMQQVRQTRKDQQNG